MNAQPNYITVSIHRFHFWNLYQVKYFYCNINKSESVLLSRCTDCSRLRLPAMKRCQPAIFSHETTGIALDDFLIFRLCHFMDTHDIVADRDPMLCLIVPTPAFCFRAAHQINAAWDCHKVLQQRHLGIYCFRCIMIFHDIWLSWFYHFLGTSIFWRSAVW